MKLYKLPVLSESNLCFSAASFFALILDSSASWKRGFAGLLSLRLPTLFDEAAFPLVSVSAVVPRLSSSRFRNLSDSGELRRMRDVLGADDAVTPLATAHVLVEESSDESVSLPERCHWIACGDARCGLSVAHKP